MIDALPFEIRQAGRYVLERDLQGRPETHGILVQASDVTIDLQGFSLDGDLGTRTGVLVPKPVRNLQILNGKVSAWGEDGVDASLARESSFSDLVIERNGGDGLQAGDGSKLLRCRSNHNAGGRGIEVAGGVEIVDCEGSGNDYGGILAGEDAVLRDCKAQANLYGPGIGVGPRGKLERCTALDNYRDGISAGELSQLFDCVAEKNLSCGIRAGDRSRLVNCEGVATADGDGLSVGAESVLERCRANGNHHNGIVAGKGSTLEGCEAEGNDLEQVLALD